MKFKPKNIFIVLLLAAFCIGISSCGSQKECSKRGKERVPMGYM